MRFVIHLAVVGQLFGNCIYGGKIAMGTVLLAILGTSRPTTIVPAIAKPLYQPLFSNRKEGRVTPIISAVIQLLKLPTIYVIIPIHK